MLKSARIANFIISKILNFEKVSRTEIKLYYCKRENRKKHIDMRQFKTKSCYNGNYSAKMLLIY